MENVTSASPAAAAVAGDEAMDKLHNVQAFSMTANDAVAQNMLIRVSESRDY